MIELTHTDGTSETFYSVDALERHPALSTLNIRRVAREYHGVGVEVGGKVFIRADKLAAALGKDAAKLAAFFNLVDDDADVVDGTIIPACEAERRAIAAERAKRFATDYAAANR